MSRFILALDQGTTSSRAILFDHAGQIHGVEQQEYPQHYPQSAWVEHAPEDIWTTQFGTAERLLRSRNVSAADIAAIGIANQRETTILWDRASGRPVANAIGWQDRRTAPMCQQMQSEGHEPFIRARTGLTLDPYFSATKVRWMLDNLPGLRERAKSGEIAFGTVDSFLLWRLTGGAVHATDVSNASRTLLFRLETMDWDDELLQLFHIPRAILPEIRPSSGFFGESLPSLFGAAIPITGVAGDQQAGTFGQACHTPGMAKNTYGTGCFLLLNTGEHARSSSHGLLSTVAWKLGASGKPVYALEGSVFVAGAAVQWLRDELEVIRHASEIEPLALAVADTGGVYFVPAFVGLGAPHWDSGVRGALFGLTRGSSKCHVARAALEAVCYQTADVLDAMRADGAVPLRDLRVDGGMTANNTLLQMQADILGVPVIRPTVTETTALGAAYLAGLAVGFWRDTAEIAAQWSVSATFEPSISEDQRHNMREGWNRAVTAARLYNGFTPTYPNP